MGTLHMSGCASGWSPGGRHHVETFIQAIVDYVEHSQALLHIYISLCGVPSQFLGHVCHTRPVLVSVQCIPGGMSLHHLHLLDAGLDTVSESL